MLCSCLITPEHKETLFILLLLLCAAFVRTLGSEWLHVTLIVCTMHLVSYFSPEGLGSKPGVSAASHFTTRRLNVL